MSKDKKKNLKSEKSSKNTKHQVVEKTVKKIDVKKAKIKPIKESKSAKEKSDVQAKGDKSKLKKSQAADAQNQKTQFKTETLEKKTSKSDSESKKKKVKEKEKKEDFDIEDDFVDDMDDVPTEDIPELEELESIEVAEEIIIDETTWDQTETKKDEDVVLTDAEGRKYCRSRDCDQVVMVEAYCRYHYLLFWKKIQVRKKILADGKLERYVEELTSRYPDKFLEMIRRDLKSEKDFLAAIQELEIDDSGADSDFEDEAQSYIEEVRGIESGGTSDEEEF